MVGGEHRLASCVHACACVRLKVFLFKRINTALGLPNPMQGHGIFSERVTRDEMVGWHHRLNGQKFQQALAVGDGQGGLACYSPWGRRELDTAERLT